MEGHHESMVDGIGIRKIGESVKRKEDDRYIQGQGQYSDDLNKAGQIYGVFVRSPYAHAVLRSIDVSQAMTVPGVVAVLTAEGPICRHLRHLDGLHGRSLGIEDGDAGNGGRQAQNQRGKPPGYNPERKGGCMRGR